MRCVLLLALTACSVPTPDPSAAVPRPHQQGGGEQTADAPDVTGQLIRGHLVWGHEERSFSECGSRRNGWVVNASGEELIDVYKALTFEPYQPMFVEVSGEWGTAPVEGFGAGYPESLTIHKLIRAENEGWGCRRDLSRVQFVAAGNEPSWHLEIGDDGIVFSSVNEARRRSFPPAEPSLQDGLLRVLSRDEDSAIRVTLEHRRCIDSMSGARYSIAASVELQGNSYSGCAIQGDKSH